MQYLKANTQVIVTVGPFVDKTDGVTPETGVTLGAADEAELIKHGSTSVTDISGATWAAVTNCDGYYSLTLTTSHTDTEGMLVVVVQDADVCLPVKQEYMVLAEAAYDSMFAAKDSGYMDVNVKAVSEDTVAADNLEADYDGTGFNKANSTIGTTTTNTDMRGTNGAALAATALTNATWTDARAGYLDELAAANMPADLDAVLADTNELQTDDVPGLIAALNNPTAAAIADAVWDEDIVAAHNGADTAGAILDDVATPANFMADVSNLDAAVSSRVPTTSLPSNFSNMSITAGSGYVDANIIQIYGDAIGAEVWGAMMNGPGSAWGVPAQVWGGTASVINSSKVGDGNDFYNGCLLVMISGDYKGMARWIDDYISVGGVFTLTRPLPGVPAAFIDEFVVISPIDSRLALNALNANALDTDAVSEIADGILKRDWTAVTGEAARSVLNALRSLRNKVSVSGGILTVTKEDDSTSAWTAAVITDAAADPITEVDPT